MKEVHSDSVDSSEQLAIMCCAPGFWLAIAPASPCDQTVESELEISRFYACEMPLALRLELANDESSQHPAKSAILADNAAFGAIHSLAPDNRNLAQKIQDHKAWRAERKHHGAAFIHHPDESARHWGAAFFMFDMGLFLASKHDEPYKASTRIQKLAIEIATLACESFLDGMQTTWKLPEPDIVHRRADCRGHWMENWPPSCMDEAQNQAACALAERRVLEQSALAATAKYTTPRI
jgi:hypothetical protein